MAKKLVDADVQQIEVNSYFQAESSHWQEVYTIPGVQAEIIRDRHAAMLGWIDGLALTPGSRVLEVGCGAGFLSIELARRGLHVQAIDSVAAMIELASNNAEQAGVTGNLTCKVDDVYALSFDDASFDLVIAIGVIPWLERAEAAIQEMARVTKPGGYLILTTANSAGLASLLDPIICPALRPLKLGLKKLFVRIGMRHATPGMVFHSNHAFDATIRRLGLVRLKGMTRGFGFSFLRRRVLPDALGTAVHWKLQRLADNGSPLFRSIGMAYFVLARKVN
jgi:2-polyprenyl-3-methyl-5-hydroxy-6-metoxy-1,4-benzoquinol methylase